MESLAPPVVAVIVAHDPGPWFEETLASFGSQSYEELSILVLDAASVEDLTGRVAGVLRDRSIKKMTPDDWDNFFTFIHRHLTRRRRS